MTAVKPGLYRAQASIPGVAVSVTPSILSFNAAGETRTFRVTFTNRSAEFDQAASGLNKVTSFDAGDFIAIARRAGADAISVA